MVGGDPAELASGSKCPWALFPCGEVGSPGGDPDIYDEDGGVFKALEKKFKGKNQTKRFSKMPHGFVTRGNIKASEFNCGTGDDVKVAVEECMGDIVKFFQKNNLLPRPPPLKKPRFVQVKTIKPDSKGLNLMVKVKDCKVDDGSADKKSWTAVCGDASGIVSFSLRSEEVAADCKPCASLRVQNARVVMVKGYIRVI